MQDLNISKQPQKNVEATEMWFLQRMLRISWTAKKSVSQKGDTARSLVKATFFTHVIRKEKLGHLMTIETIERKRNQGNQ